MSNGTLSCSSADGLRATAILYTTGGQASMFMAAGLVYAALGHDQLSDMKGVARAMPVTVLAFALAAWLGRPRQFEKIAPMKAKP